MKREKRESQKSLSLLFLGQIQIDPEIILFHLLELSPLVTLQLCPRCDREEIFLADGLAGVGQTLRLSAVTTGHPLSLALDEELVPEPLAVLLS